MLGLICFCAFQTVGFERSCQSDGCIGVFFILFVTWGFVGLQLLVMIPIYAARRMKEELPTAKWVILWVVVSVLPALATHLYIFRRNL